MQRLSELVSHLTPSTYAQLALILFVAVFVTSAWRQTRRHRRAEQAEAAQLPLLADDLPGGAQR